MASINELMQWTFTKESEIPNEVQDILVDGEIPQAAYKTMRDVAIITNKRIIISDKQGVTGKKVEVYTIPFKSIVMYSSENAGILDSNSEIELWTRAGKLKLNLRKDVDIRKLDKIIGSYIL